MVALIDADSLIYKSGFSFEETTVWNAIEVALGLEDTADTVISGDIMLAKNAIDSVIDNILIRTGCSELELWVTGKENFRYKVMDTYKHNRTGSRKPVLYNELYSYLLNKYKALVADGVEADDMVVALKTKYPMKYTLCAIDKDVLLQTEGNHYNYGKDEFVTVSKAEADRFFWFQVLTGDSVDGYKGCEGIGKVKANKILNEAEEEAFCTDRDIKDVYRECVLKTYLENNHDEYYFLQTCRVANMHQIILEEDGSKYIKLYV